MWKVIYIAPSREHAEQLQRVLVREGILAELQAESQSQVEVLVPETEAEEAYDLITEEVCRHNLLQK